MIKLVIFDIDDTLYNEIDYVKSGYKVVAKEIEEKYKLNNVYAKMMNLFKESSKNVFNRLLDENGIKYSKEEILDLVNMYRYHKPDIELDEDTKKLLSKLRKDYKMAIVSDGNYTTQQLKVDALNLNKYFDVIILTDKYGKEYWKPNKISFEKLKEKFKIQYDEMIYIGDNPNKDFYISKYGIKTVRYYNKLGIYYNDDYLENIKEQYKIENIKDFNEIIS